MSYGKMIREKRQSLALSRLQLADRIGVTEAYIGFLEGERRFPSAELLPSLMNALGMDTEEREQLFALAEEVQKQKGQMAATRRTSVFRAAIQAHETTSSKPNAPDTLAGVQGLDDLQNEEMRALWNDVWAAAHDDPAARETLQQMARLIVRGREHKDG